MRTVGEMLALTLLAVAQAATAAPPPIRARAGAQVSIRIIQGARVEQGSTAEPHSRGRAVVAEPGGLKRIIEVVEFQ